jgi:hypothetical protein
MPHPARRASGAALPPDVDVPGARTAQRCAWGALALFVAAAAAGVFGHGPWNRVTRAGDGLQVEYDRVLRVGAASELRLALEGPSPERVRLAVAFDGARVRIDDVFPEPARQRALPDGAELEIEIGGKGPAQIALRLLPLEPGRSELRLAVDSRPPARLAQRVLP